jgi:hypothetical protein
MDILNESRFIERLKFFNGQRLFASDLQGIDAFNEQMRRAHNRFMHQPGIGNGFAVSGKKGDREVTIGPGYAIDALGREIILTQDRVEPVPPVAGEQNGDPVLYDLTVSYPADSDLEETERRQGVCGTSGTLRLKEEPVFCWVRLGGGGKKALDEQSQQEIVSGMRIILARAAVLNCQLNQDLSVAQRLSARPARQPYVCCGVAAPTDWKLWEVADAPPDNKRLLQAAGIMFQSIPLILPFGLRAEVDTSGCGFMSKPCYSVRIDGPRVMKAAHEFAQTSPPTRVEINFVADGLVQVVEPTPRGFRLDVLILMQLVGAADFIDGQKAAGLLHTFNPTGSFATTAKSDFDEELERLREFFPTLFKDWTVAWTGVEG